MSLCLSWASGRMCVQWREGLLVRVSIHAASRPWLGFHRTLLFLIWKSFKNYSFVLAASGLSCGTRGLRCITWDLSLGHTDSSCGTRAQELCRVGFVASQHVGSPWIRNGTWVPCTARRILKSLDSQGSPPSARQILKPLDHRGSPPSDTFL